MTPLFNGKNLSGWVPEGPKPGFSVSSGAIHVSPQVHAPNWLRSATEYEDFRLRFDYRLDQWAEAAVLLRAPRCERPHHAGLALMLSHDFHNRPTPWTTGAVLGLLPPKKFLAPSFGAWRSALIELRGPALTLSIDGAEIQNARVDGRLPRGFIGFPCTGHGYSLRGIEIEDLGRPTPWLDLFDGHSLYGWQQTGGGRWTIASGTLRGANGHGILYALPVAKDFDFSAVVRTHDRVNSGVFLRGAPGARRGFEVQIYSPVDSVFPTGSIYNLERSRISADLEARWFHLRILVAGTACTVWVDGEQTAHTAQLPPEYASAAGRIGLQIHSDAASVEFRDVRLRLLDA